MTLEAADRVEFWADTKAIINLYKDGKLIGSLPTQDAFYRLELNDAWRDFVRTEHIEWKG